MSIVNQIYEMADNYTRRTGKAPTAIYVGIATRRELFAATEPWRLCSGGQSKRPEFHGLLIFEVDADEHLNVG